MRALRILLLPILLLSLVTGCTPLRNGEVARFAASGIEGVTSRQAVVGSTGHSLMIGQVLVLRQGGRVALTAEVGQTWSSGEGRVRMTSAWHDGMELPFRRVARYERFCTGAGNCQGFRTGVFLFTRPGFERAAQTGYRATLIGPDAVVDIYIPPALFVEARERAQASGLWPG